MTVQFVCPEGSNLAQLQKAYPDLYHDDTSDGQETWWIGKDGDDYWDSDRDLYNYGEDGPEDLCQTRDLDKEWMTREDAVEFCGFAETLIEGSTTRLEGNGSWAQGQLRKEDDYQTGAQKAKKLLETMTALNRQILTLAAKPDIVPECRADPNEPAKASCAPAAGSAPAREWWVYSTAIAPGWLMLYCEKTGATGTVRDPSREEWKAAFYAPSNPYRWHDESRVVVDAQEPLAE